MTEEFFEIYKICKKYGCGNVMEWASAIWRWESKNKGYPTSGCFVPTCNEFIKDEYRNDKQHALYDELVNKILEVK